MKATERNPTLTLRKRPIAWLATYGALVGGSLLFFLPFLWLITTSAKVDRELFAQDRTTMPIKPNARLASPYIDERYYREASQDPHGAFLDDCVAVIKEKRLPMPDTVDRALAEKQMAKGLLRKLEAAVPPGEWAKGPDVMTGRTRAIATPMVLTELFQNVYRRLEISTVNIRSYDLDAQELGDGQPMVSRLANRTESVAGLTETVDFGTSCALVRYDFSKGETVVLEQTFRTTFDTARLHRVQLTVRPDDNWQRLSLFIEKLGARFEAVRPVYLGNFDWVTLTWQEPGPDDHSNRIKSYIHLKKVAEGPQFVSDPHRIKVGLEIARTSQLQAWWGKISLNYMITAQYIPFVRYIGNTLFLIIMNVTLQILASSLVAYGISRLIWPGRDFVFLLILATLMVPEQVTMIPAFLIWKNLGFYNTLVPLFLGSAFGGAINIFLLRQFMKGIPRDIEEAAKIDGCGFLRIYWHMALPLMRPALVAIALLTIVGGWNDFKGVLLYVSDQRLYTLAFGLYAFAVQVANNPAQTLAASLLAMAPVIVLFLFAQRHFIRGITLTGMR